MKRFVSSSIVFLIALSLAIAVSAQQRDCSNTSNDEVVLANPSDQQNPISWKITTDEEDDGTIIYNLIVSNHTNKNLYVTGKVKVQSTKEIVHFAKTINAGRKLCVHSEVNEKFAVLEVNYEESMW